MFPGLVFQGETAFRDVLLVMDEFFTGFSIQSLAAIYTTRQYTRIGCRYEVYIREDKVKESRRLIVLDMVRNWNW